MTIESDEFKCLKDKNIAGVTFNAVSRDEYTPKVERWNRQTNETDRCYFEVLIF